MNNNKELLNHIKAGGQEAHEAFKSIYKDNYPKVSHMIFQKGGNEEDARDVFQDSMIVFHKMVLENRFREESGINTLIYAISRNLWYQKLKKTKKHEDLSVVEDTKGVDVTMDWDGFTQEKVVRSLINELSEDCRKIIRLYYYNEWSMQDIQNEFGLSSSQAAKNKKYRCMKNLMDIFKKKGIEITSFNV
ncbi:MAG: RNA polymerase sigma factor [Bacteroidota bacterium]